MPERENGTSYGLKCPECGGDLTKHPARLGERFCLNQVCESYEWEVGELQVIYQERRMDHPRAPRVYDYA